MQNTKEKNHALDNATAWMQSISAMVSAMHNAENADDGDDSIDKAREAIQESPLSVSVREGWHNPGEESDPEEFCILLSTGGPALRIIGDLGRYNSPESPRLQYQDWGTPWTDFDTTSDQDDDLLEFCQQFYFGE